MRLLKKLGVVDLYKKFEETPDATYLVQAGGTNPLSFTSGAPISMARRGLNPLPETITRLAGGCRGKLEIKTSLGMPGRGLRNCHDSKCNATLWIEWAET